MPAYKIRAINTIKAEMLLFGQLLSTIQEAEFDKLLGEINNQKASVLIEYLHRFMEFIGSEKDYGSSGNALKFYDKVVSRFGRGIVLRAGFKLVSLVTPINNYEIGH